MGPRGAATPDDGIRYSLLPSTTPNTPKGGVSRKLHFNFAAAADIHDTANGTNAVNGSTPPTATLYADYIYLDADERRRYAQSAHEYLIEQVQFTGDENVAMSNTSTKAQNVRLNFNHPVKYLAWVVAHKDRHGLFNTYAEGVEPEEFGPILNAKLLLNGHDRFSTRYGSYFNKVQPFQHWQSNPATGVYAYSFALRPADQTLPSGSCNFSRIDNATLQLTFKAASVAANGSQSGRLYEFNLDPENTTLGLETKNNLENLKIFAVNYNVLRVLSGMGGLAYILLRRKGARTNSWIKRIRGKSFSDRSTSQPLVGKKPATPPNCGELLIVLRTKGRRAKRTVGQSKERPGREWNSGTVTIAKIGQSAAKPLQDIIVPRGRFNDSTKVGPNERTFGSKRESRPSHQILRKKGYQSTAIKSFINENR